MADPKEGAGTGGRPTKYDPAFCDMVVPFMEQGYSTTALAGHLGVSRQTVYNWMDENPQFFDAVKQGMAASAIWWENCLRDTAAKGEGNATAAIFGLKNRASEDWRDKQEVDHRSPDGSMTPAVTVYQLPDNGRG
jgi:DNA-binding XRE family transcriptional regulator